MRLRAATNADSEPLQALISEVYAEYGERMNLDGADKDLLDLEGEYTAKGGAFVVLDDEGRIRGSHATLPDPERAGVCGFRRLYLDPALRGESWGPDIMQWAIDWATDHGQHRVEFWSDVRFERAHRFFARFGFVKSGEVRTMTDAFDPYHEYFFYLELPRGAGTRVAES